MTPESIKEKIAVIALKRSVLIQLSNREDLGNLTIDVVQALEEINDLIADFQKTFPDLAIS
ncbi:hypothetical protein Syn7502_01647 [Synechococcus sp. PCC 7502]|uniref:hypothetical protein n=1 Tax=Synechococcus sp. PCC 7502 TaxID=1173263 RepID=UPI00029F9927|nr:hypothetical protein [Synechococcus sp. PCC 7502]AFY73703.1 hypothetical protein Syn7502_01647 [Synechococcus sp. PCC 7502]